MNENLKDFLSAWLDWSNACVAAGTYVGVPNPFRFPASSGLCVCLDEYLKIRPAPPVELYWDLKLLFKKDGLNKYYPFGKLAYENRGITYTQWACPVRRMWVARKLGLVISTDLYNMFTHWLMWSDALIAGVELATPYDFSPSYGLCNHVEDYANKHPGGNISSEFAALINYAAYPFGESNYDLRRFEGSQHACPLRRAFVKKHITAYEDFLCKS
ncbi:hypothetical protein QLL94_gp03 [Pectobacterium phage PP2]|uniref:Uncharacterized protein n=1 Tax=Pectobacterium phage PP2 TaxID=1897743 RepID=A0A1W5P4Y9_9CAUD|nr:hypothetical protein QLL94_gp03 [Pectobacterium phage PP2]AOT25369.1 hypothetical protein PP2_003 [Pectobacterium phage PP2]